MIYDFIAVPRNAGKYEIPPVKFVYYDTSTNKYATIESKGFTLNVAQGAKGGGVSDFLVRIIDRSTKTLDVLNGYLIRMVTHDTILA